MLTYLRHISTAQHQQLQQSVSSIIKAIAPEKIICYGTRTNATQTWSCFLDDINETVITTYDLLIITRDKEKAKRDEIARTISQYDTASTKFITIVHSIEAVNDALKDENFFFSTLFHKGALLHDHNNISLMVPPATIHTSLPVAQIEKYWNTSFELGQNFLEAATLCFSKKQHNVAIFLLHQSVEHTCIGLIKIHTGYRPATHKLAKLLDLIDNFSLDAITAFRRTTEKESGLFKVLDSAYSDARYTEEYTVSADTITYLIGQANQLLEIAAFLYQHKLDNAKTSSSQPLSAADTLSFESIGLDTPAHIVLQKGEFAHVHIESENGAKHAIKTVIDNGRLWINTGNTFDAVDEVTVFITYTKLNGLIVHRSGNVICKGPIEGSKLGIIQNGRGNIDIEVNVLILDVTLTKTGSVTIKGSVDCVRVLNHRGGNFNGKELEASVADVTIRGKGDVLIHIEEELNAELRGEGNLVYTGSPRIKSLAIHGRGTLKQI